MAKKEKNIKPYPAVFEPFAHGYGVYFPDLPGAGTSGEDYEGAMCMAKECLSLHLYGLLKDHDPVPKPSKVADIQKKSKKGHLVALIEPDVFAVKTAQESEKTVHVDITIPKKLLKTADLRARQLGINRSKLFQKALQEVL